VASIDRNTTGNDARKWLLQYMAAEIDCVVVTDHNTGEWIDPLKHALSQLYREKPEGFRELYLFPGVEINVNGGFHMIAILKPSAGSADVAKLLGAVGYDGDFGKCNGATTKTAGDVITEILKSGALPIPAHTDEANGLLRIQAGTTNKAAMHDASLAQVLTHPGVFAIEVVDRHAEKPSAYKRRKLNWAEVLGSDCHSFNGGRVPGSHFTWVKMTSPSLEGLRLALIDGQEVSIRRSDEGNFNPFICPEHFIASITIHQARALGRNRPAHVDFNPYFNAIIGGRGTGKSSVVHSLRLLYRREGELSELEGSSEPKQTFDQFNKVAKKAQDGGGLRSDTTLSAVLHRDGEKYRINWRQDGSGTRVEKNCPNNTWQPASSQAITSDRFPIRLFSQGQIAALSGENRKGLLAIIDAAAGVQVYHAAFEEAKRTYFATRSKMRDLAGRLGAKENVDTKLADVVRKLDRFEEAQHALVLKSYQAANAQKGEMQKQVNGVNKVVNKILELARDLPFEEVAKDVFSATDDCDVLLFSESLKVVVNNAKDELEAVANNLADMLKGLEEGINTCPWSSRCAKAFGDYELLKSELLSQGVSDPSEYGKLVQQRQQLEKQLDEYKGISKELTHLEVQASDELCQVISARKNISQARKEFLRGTLAENQYVRIGIQSFGNSGDEIAKSLRDVLNAPPDKYVDDIYAAGQQDGQDKGIVADLLRARSLGIENENGSLAFEESLAQLRIKLQNAFYGHGNFGAWFNKFLASEAEKRPELIDRVACWFPDDGLEIHYSPKGNGKDFQPISQGSAGQRAAAMLAFLLAHGSEPLVLDQPEDDLDNHLIYDLVVKQIRSNKMRRQLIVVTHNPNIVVNGDAELLCIMGFNSQCYVKHQGSLQEEIIRSEICKIMEGGPEAFARRYRRLGEAH
jgi:energy-coupling factor transporter ATP-binding protein EcfA2